MKIGHAVSNSLKCERNCILDNIIKTQDRKNKSFALNKYFCHVCQMKYTG